MTRRRVTRNAASFILAFSLVVFAPALSQDPAAVSGTNALDYVRVLTSPDFESRKGGLEGGVRTSAWIGARPGLLVTKDADPDVLKKMLLKRWKLALEWTSGTGPEEYAKKIESLMKNVGPTNILVAKEAWALKGFPADLVNLVSLLKPKEMTEAQIMSGGMDLFGQNFLNLLREVRPPSF